MGFLIYKQKFTKILENQNNEKFYEVSVELKLLVKESKSMMKKKCIILILFKKSPSFYYHPN